MGAARLLCGPQSSERAARINALVRQHAGRSLLIVPSQRYANRRAEQIILEGGLPGIWGRPVLTFDCFADGILRSSGAKVSRIEGFERRFLLESVISRLNAEGKLRALGPAVETEGFLTHIQRVIEQLKQAAIDPAAFQERVAKRRRPSPLDPVVAAVYAAYQGALREADLYDRIGLFWQADVLCRQDRPQMLESVDVIALDGFDDFTPSEFRLLESVAAHVSELVFGLNADLTDPEAAELYAVQAETAGAVVRRLHASVENLPGRQPSRYTEFAGAYLLYRGAPPSPAALIADLEIVPCPGPVHEIETIGRRVKTLLVEDGVLPDDIVVVFRDLRSVAATLGSVFAEFGIDVRIAYDAPLAESAVGTLLLHLLDVVDAWRREDMVDVVASPWFAPGRPSQDDFSGQFSVLARAAGVLSGYAEWEERLVPLMDRVDRQSDDAAIELTGRMPQARSAANALLDRIKLLKTLADAIPQQATLCEFVRSVEQLLCVLGVGRAVEQHPIEEVRESERSALRTLHAVLGALRAWQENAASPERLTRERFVALLRQALDDTPVAHSQPKHGVLCLDVEGVRHLRFRYVFFGGVNEGVVPQPPAPSAIYSEEDIRDLESAGVALESRRARSVRELLLFHHVLGAAEERLVLTWRTLSAEGKEARPSPFLEDLRRLFPDCGIERPARRASEFYPAPDEVASWRDLRNLAFAAHPTLREMFRDVFAQTEEAARIERRRYGRESCDSFDGVLGDPHLIERIAARFGEQHEFSVNQLEMYLGCPFQFLVDRILNVGVVEEPQAEIAPVEYGSLAHAVLEVFHRKHQGVPVSEMDPDEAAASMRACIARVFGGKAAQSAGGLLEVERLRMQALMDRYLLHERARDEARWRPMHFEVSFGTKRAPSEDPWSKTAAFELQVPSGRVRLGGRIDRIDEGDAGLRIVDYKTGEPPTGKDIREGHSLQMPLYALALEQCITPGSTCAEAVFLRIGFPKATVCPSPKLPWDEVKAIAVQQLETILAGIRAGRFLPQSAGKGCSYCGAKRACRFEQWRLEQKAAGEG